MKMRFLMVLLVSMFVAGAAFAAGGDGSLFVDVTSCAGTVLRGVTVTLTGGAVPQVQVTDYSGQARWTSLPPGNYTVKTQLEGFVTADAPAVVSKDQSTTLPVKMQPTLCEQQPGNAACCPESGD